MAAGGGRPPRGRAAAGEPGGRRQGGLGGQEHGGQQNTACSRSGDALGPWALSPAYRGPQTPTREAQGPAGCSVQSPRSPHGGRRGPEAAVRWRPFLPTRRLSPGTAAGGSALITEHLRSHWRERALLRAFSSIILAQTCRAGGDSGLVPRAPALWSPRPGGPCSLDGHRR